MFSWLIGSTAAIKQEVNNFLTTNRAQWTTFDSSQKELKNTRLNDLMTSLWGKKPAWDFLGWVSSARLSKIKKTLSEDLSQRKSAALPLIQEKISLLTLQGKTPDAIAATLHRDPLFKIYKPSELHLLVFLGMKGFDLVIRGGTWGSFKEAARSAAFRTTLDSPDLLALLKVKKNNLSAWVKTAQTGPKSATVQHAQAVLGTFADLRSIVPNRLLAALHPIPLEHSESLLETGKARRKLSSLPLLEQAIKTLLESGKTDQDIVEALEKLHPARNFPRHELHLLTQLMRKTGELLPQANWNQFLTESIKTLSENEISFQLDALLATENLEPITAEIESNRTPALPQEITDRFLSAILLLSFHPNLIDTLPPSLVASLSRIERSPHFETQVSDSLNGRFSQGPFREITAENGRHLQLSGLDQQSNKNKMEDSPLDEGTSFPLLDIIKHDIERGQDYFSLSFERPDGQKKPASKIAKQSLTQELSQFQAHAKGYDPQFNTLLQRLLHQHAWTAVVNDTGWSGALKTMLDSQYLAFGKKGHESLQALITEAEDGSVRIDYTYKAALTRSHRDAQEESGSFIAPFSYSLQRDEAAGGWKIEGPLCQPVVYSSSSLK